MSLALRSGKAYPREVERAEMQSSPTVQMKVSTDPALRRSYSDVVRAGSPSSESGVGDIANSTSPRSASDSFVGPNEESIEIPRVSRDAETDTGANAQWTKVVRRGNRGMNVSPTPSRNSIASANRFERLHVDEINAVELAEKQLMAARLKLIHARMTHKLPADRISGSGESLGRQTRVARSSPGKGKDLRKFGNPDLSKELDPEEQREPFALSNEVKRMRVRENSAKKGGYARRRRASTHNSAVSEDKYPNLGISPTPRDRDYEISSNHREVKHGPKDRVPHMKKDSNRVPMRPKRGSERDDQPHGSTYGYSKPQVVAPGVHRLSKSPQENARRSHSVLRPINQLDPSSYLGTLMNKLGKPSRKDKDRRESDDQELSDVPSLRSVSESSSSFDDSDVSDDDSESEPRRRSSAKKKKSRRMRLKPIAPEPYDGTPDSRLFHKFVMQAKNYMEDGRVPPNKQVYRLADFLKGRAYEFYLMQVAYRPREWTLVRCLQGLFDFCFPVDYRSQLRLKLRKCQQGSRRIREFVFELQELSAMIGGVNQQDLVNRLWFGCDKRIRSELYLRNLHPEMSSFNEVAEAAEIVELALSAMDTCDLSDSDDESNHDAASSVEEGQESSDETSDGDSSDSVSNEVQRRPRTYSNKGTAVTKRMPKLSPEEREELLVAGKCFRCKGVGHRSRDCPEGETVRMSAVGTTTVDTEDTRNFSMSIGPAEFDDDEDVEDLDAVMCGVMRVVVEPEGVPVPVEEELSKDAFVQDGEWQEGGSTMTTGTERRGCGFVTPTAVRGSFEDKTNEASARTPSCRSSLDLSREELPVDGVEFANVGYGGKEEVVGRLIAFRLGDVGTKPLPVAGAVAEDGEGWMKMDGRDSHAQVSRAKRPRTRSQKSTVGHSLLTFGGTTLFDSILMAASAFTQYGGPRHLSGTKRGVVKDGAVRKKRVKRGQRSEASRAGPGCARKFRRTKGMRSC